MKIDKKYFVRDIALIFVLLALGLLMLLPKGHKGQTVEIRVDGVLYGSYALSTDKSITIEKDGSYLGTAVIKGGKVYMKNAVCDGQDCVKRGTVWRSGQCILCLPSGISISVKGQGGLDGVTG